MMAAIGPFWDANETWLVLAVGLLLVAFPAAHGIILDRALSAGRSLLLIGLILRGVAFEFRAKVPARAQAALEPRISWRARCSPRSAQGYMLGVYVLGLEPALRRASPSACWPRSAWPRLLCCDGRRPG